jgi:hypothetical protein
MPYRVLARCRAGSNPNNSFAECRSGAATIPVPNQTGSTMKGHSQIQYDHRIPLMVPQSLYKEIRKAAQENTLSVSAFLRQAALSQLRQNAKEKAAA